MSEPKNIVCNIVNGDLIPNNHFDSTCMDQTHNRSTGKLDTKSLRLYSAV